MQVFSGSAIKSVQRGNSTISNGSTTLFVDIADVDESKSCVITSQRQTGFNDNNTTASVNLTGDGRLYFRRQGSSGTTYVAWEVVEYA